MKENKTLRMYHNQASEDHFAKQQDTPCIVQVSFKQIKEAYNEMLQDLLLEAQEAY